MEKKSFGPKTDFLDNLQFWTQEAFEWSYTQDLDGILDQLEAIDNLKLLRPLKTG